MKHPNTFKLTYQTKSGIYCSVLVNTNAPTETAQDGATGCKWAEERARAYCADKGAEFVALAEPAESVQSLTARGMSCLIWDYVEQPAQSYATARQAEQENAAKIREHREHVEKIESVLKRQCGEDFRAFIERRKGETYQRDEAQQIAAINAQHRAEIAQHFYQNNTRAAFLAEYLPTLADILQTYAGKPYGKATRDKITELFKAKTGARLYLSEDAATVCPVGISCADSLTIYARKQDGTRAEFINDENRIQANPAELMRGAYVGEFCEDIPAAVENLIQKRAEIIQKAQDLAKLCDEYNRATVGNLPRLVNSSRYWSTDVLREENR